MPTTAAETLLHVAVGAVVHDSDVLISKRLQHLHQGGLWEFPGGKVEPGESVYQALCRELYEELGILVEAAEPLIEVEHDYPDRRVLLDVWRVTGFAGQPEGRQGQDFRWVPLCELHDYQFPAANAPILGALRV